MEMGGVGMKQKVTNHGTGRSTEQEEQNQR